MYNKLIFTLILTFGFLSSNAQKEEQHKDAKGNSYKTYTNDPSNSRWYTLSNGLTVILAQNSEKPRVQTLIATKAGSSSDPSDNTGLAHYLEHMLFKGTDKYGTLDYAKEKVLLAQIDKLYEEYNHTTDETKRKEIYREIDRVSGEASKFAIANEYDKMMQGIGAQGTNAFTSFEQTVYVNDIPSNQVKTWLDIESERFRNPVLRLFHTELEAVYEEKNRTLDNDGRQVYEELYAKAFPNHNYGRQTTIGTIEHLKNPSLEKIRKYYNTYYVPNNMAVIMVGDLDLDATFEQIKAKFSYMKNNVVPTMTFEDEQPLLEKKVITVTGPSAESLTMGYRVPDALDKEANLLKLVDLILANSKAGLIDVNMVNAQKCLEAYCSPSLLKERGLHYFSGRPLEGQSLEELEQLFYDQLDKLKAGDFDMELVKSIVLNQKVDQIRQYESYTGTAYSLMNAFILGRNWSDEIAELDELLKYSKEDIIAFAKKYYTEGHIVIYKRKGEQPGLAKVEKPEITKVEVNRGKTSPFVQDILNRKVNPIAPQILDYEKEIEFGTANSIPIWRVKEGDKQLFSLYYVLDLGSFNDQKLALAVDYLKYLGTDKYTSDQISEEFYKLACDFGVSTSQDQSYVYLNGLASNFDEAVSLFEHLLANAQPSQPKLDVYITQIIKSRENAKLNKGVIMSKLRSYALYGAQNPSNYILSANELKNIKATELTDYIHNLTSYKHKIWYSGPLSLADLEMKLQDIHSTTASFIAAPPLKEFEMQETKIPKVYFANYEMVQAEIMWLKKSNKLNMQEIGDIAMFNEYFGGGMSSIVFQEIRESKALAYSTYSYYATAQKLEDNNMVMAYVGTQSDKLGEGVKAMNELLTELPLDEKTFENGKNALRQNLETSRILKTSILFNYDKNLKLGLEVDSRKMTTARLETISLAEVEAFHKNKIKGDYVYALIGDRTRINKESLADLGDFIELSLEELFGY
jgi:predicted Zn-dependent peptidase